MTICWQCGDTIQGQVYRRNVTVVRFRVFNRKNELRSRGSSTGRRSLCKRCARTRDVTTFAALAAVVVLFAVGSKDNKGSSVTNSAADQPTVQSAVSSNNAATSNLPAPDPAPEYNATASGIRWQMSPISGGYRIRMELLQGGIANVRVAPEFHNLSLADMNARVDRVEKYIEGNWHPGYGEYTYLRDGSVERLN